MKTKFKIGTVATGVATVLQKSVNHAMNEYEEKHAISPNDPETKLCEQRMKELVKGFVRCGGDDHENKEWVVRTVQGNLADVLGDTKGAIREQLSAIPFCRSDTERSKSLNNLSSYLLSAASREADASARKSLAQRAVKFAEEAVRLNPDNTLAVLNLGANLFLAGDEELACQAYTTILGNRDPSSLTDPIAGYFRHDLCPPSFIENQTLLKFSALRQFISIAGQ